MHEMASEASTVPLFFFCVSTLSVLGRARFDMMQMRNETVCNGDHVEWEKGVQNLLPSGGGESDFFRWKSFLGGDVLVAALAALAEESPEGITGSTEGA